MHWYVAGRRLCTSNDQFCAYFITITSFLGYICAYVNSLSWEKWAITQPKRTAMLNTRGCLFLSYFDDRYNLLSDVTSLRFLCSVDVCNMYQSRRWYCAEKMLSLLPQQKLQKSVEYSNVSYPNHRRWNEFTLYFPITGYHTEISLSRLKHYRSS